MKTKIATALSGKDSLKQSDLLSLNNLPSSVLLNNITSKQKYIKNYDVVYMRQIKSIRIVLIYEQYKSRSRLATMVQRIRA